MLGFTGKWNVSEIIQITSNSKRSLALLSFVAAAHQPAAWPDEFMCSAPLTTDQQAN